MKTEGVHIKHSVSKLISLWYLIFGWYTCGWGQPCFDSQPCDSKDKVAVGFEHGCLLSHRAARVEFQASASCLHQLVCQLRWFPKYCGVLRGPPLGVPSLPQPHSGYWMFLGSCISQTPLHPGVCVCITIHQLDVRWGVCLTSDLVLMEKLWPWCSLKPSSMGCLSFLHRTHLLLGDSLFR